MRSAAGVIFAIVAFFAALSGGAFAAPRSSDVPVAIAVASQRETAVRAPRVGVDARGPKARGEPARDETPVAITSGATEQYRRSVSSPHAAMLASRGRSIELHVRTALVACDRDESGPALESYVRPLRC